MFYYENAYKTKRLLNYMAETLEKISKEGDMEIVNREGWMITKFTALSLGVGIGLYQLIEHAPRIYQMVLNYLE